MNQTAKRPANQWLCVTGFRRNGRGFNTQPSRFISMMGYENAVRELTMTNIEEDY